MITKWKILCENGTLYSCEECREKNERNHKDFHTLNTIHSSSENDTHAIMKDIVYIDHMKTVDN
jgi:hypothetical protein